VAGQDRCFALRLAKFTAALKKRGGRCSCLLRTLTNTRPPSATVVVRLQRGRLVRLALLSFQKLEIYPPRWGGGRAQGVFGTFAGELWRRTTWPRGH